ncbi:hypothetical protein ES708_19426 [subsurface metagenome]
MFGLWTPDCLEWLLLLIILTPLVYFTCRWWDKRWARTRADRIIHNELPATVIGINECIAVLNPRAGLWHSRSGEDVLRVEQLRAIRDRIE